MPPPSRSHRDYTIGWICALESELIAARAMLDEIHHEKLPAIDGDSNNYKFGRIGRHNVVIAPLPSGTYGTNSAASVASQMLRSFQWLRVRLLVGIGGGVPKLAGDDPADIRLGDVVVSDPTYQTGGVIQYDLGKTNEGEKRPERIGTLNKPPVFIRTAVASLKANHKFEDSPLKNHIVRMIDQNSRLAPEYMYQGKDNDILFKAGYRHQGQGTDCTECLQSERVPRPHRPSCHPRIHYGTIASGNQVVKDSVTRDYWRDTEGVLCFEMEAAGLMDDFPCLVIRGICDYADSHKNTKWQPYAAATAAAYAKDLLEEIAPSAANATDPSFGGQPEPGNVHWMVPKNTNTLFIGRKDILKKLDRSLGPQSNSLQTSERQKRFVISGDGGIGKSEVCLKFANDHRQHFWGIFWIDASSEATAKQAFIEVGKLCGANAETFERVKTWLASTPHSWLLIIDNADDPKIDYAAFFPSGNKGNIILTSRNPQCRELAPLGSEILDHLDRQNAKSLLFNAAKMDDASLREANQKAAEKVVQALSFHTLAIIQAGAFIKNRRFSLEQYSTLFKTQEKRILEYRLTQEESTYGSVFATFEISATHLQSSQDQSAADALSLLKILGFFHFQEIPESMFSRARDEAIAVRELTNRGRLADKIYQLSELQTSRLPLFMMQQKETALIFLPRWRETLDLLESYSLIKIRGNGKDLSFSMHPLIHTWTRIRHELESRKEGWRAASSIIALSMRGKGYDMIHEKLRPHVGAYLDHPVSEYITDMSILEISQTHFHICYLLLSLREISRTRQLLDVHNTFKAWTSATCKSGLYVQSLIAEVLALEGQHKEAVELLEWLCTKHSNNLFAQGRLAGAYRASEQHQKAISLLEPIVKMRKETEEAENIVHLQLCHELGIAYIENGQSEKATTILEHVVEMRKKTMAPAHLNRLASEFDLGRAYMDTYDYEKAAKILQQVLETLRGIADVEDFRLLDAQYLLAEVYIGMGRDHCEKAAELLEQVIAIQERRLGPDDPVRLHSEYRLAEAYIGMGRDHHKKAARLLERVIRIRERTSKPDDPFLLQSQRLLEEVYRRIEVEKNAESRSAQESGPDLPVAAKEPL